MACGSDRLLRSAVWPADLPRVESAAGTSGALALSVTLLFGAATLLMLRVLRSPPAATSPLVLSLAFVAPLLRARPGGLTALGGLAALPLIAPVTWWEPDMALGLPQSVAFLIVGVLAAALPAASVPGGRDTRRASAGDASRSRRDRRAADGPI